jgi:ABC-type Fe3+-hydroxamate transport system substrate-binding protein
MRRYCTALVAALTSANASAIAALSITIALWMPCSAVAQDADLREHGALGAPPARIVSLVPSATDLVVALGERHRLVARTMYDRNPLLARLPSVGGTIDPNLEAVLSVRPDLVLTWDDSTAPGLRQRLERAGLHTVVIRATTLADVRGTIRQLGGVLKVSGKADSLMGRIQSGLDSVKALSDGRAKVRVFYLVWARPLITTAGGTFIDSLITIAGGENVFGDLSGPWPMVSIESVIARQPDVILWSRHRSGLQENLADDPRWRGVRAARLGRVLAVDGELMARPGPRLVEAARALERLIHHGERSP